MRFTLCSFGDELNSRSPVKGTTDTYRKGARVDATWLHSRGKHQYEPAFQSKATDAAVLPDRRREEPSREPSRIGAKLLAGIWRYWSDTGQAAGQPSNAA
jgi:hypothetical protein